MSIAYCVHWTIIIYILFIIRYFMKMASKNTPSVGRSTVERRPPAQSPRPGYHFEAKTLSDTNAMPDFMLIDVIGILLIAFYLLF